MYTLIGYIRRLINKYHLATLENPPVELPMLLLYMKVPTCHLRLIWGIESIIGMDIAEALTREPVLFKDDGHPFFLIFHLKSVCN